MTTFPLTATATRPVLADVVFPGARVRDAVLIACGAGLTILGAQITIQTGVSPVPITGQTLGVVLAGAALGARRGMASQLLYVLLGLLLPVYADGEQGFDVIWGATGGYLIGFIAAAGVIGALAERGADRKPLVAFGAFVAAQLVIFGLGVPWLKVATDMSWGDAVHYGFTLFIVGGLIKALAGAALTPSAWRLVKRIDRA